MILLTTAPADVITRKMELSAELTQAQTVATVIAAAIVQTDADAELVQIKTVQAAQTAE